MGKRSSSAAMAGRRLEIVERGDPAPAAGQLLVQVEAAGVQPFDVFTAVACSNGRGKNSRKGWQ